MEEILIEVSITNNEEKEIYELLSKKNVSKYKYIEPNEYKTKVEYNYKKKLLRRDNDQLFMEFNFNTKEALILLKENDKEMIIPINIINIEKTKIEYQLENQNFVYEIIEK